MRSSTIFTVAGITLVAGAVAYAVWFDSKRRNDAEFRRKLRKEKKKIEKTAAQQKTQESISAATSSVSITQADLRAAIEKVKAEGLPSEPDAKEQYFMQQVNMGEKLCAQGGAFALPAAMCFFRALRVYPSPLELIMIYQQTVPEPIFKIVMEMTQLDTKARIEGYWDDFPPKDMNVTIKPVDIPDPRGVTIRKRVLMANKDYSAGDIIYKEQPIVAALDADLEGKGDYCSFCLKSMDSAEAIRPATDKLNSAYCSHECEVKASTQYQSLLFSSDSPVPIEIDPTNTPEQQEKRHAAQDVLVELLKTSQKVSPLLVSRFVARQVSGELSKLFPGAVAAASSTIYGNAEYSIFDHLERLRYLELTVPDEEVKAIRDVFEHSMAGLADLIETERYTTFKGKVAYNAFGVCLGEGRSDKPEEERPEDRERTRTPIGTSKQVGSAIYFVSSYAQHSCDPSARPTFPEGTSELHLVATRDIKAGDELTVAYVDVTQHEDESVADARRRRRQELARGWRFSCPCERCTAEAEAGHAHEEAEGETPASDESKLETPVERREAGEAEEFAANVD